MNEIILNGIVGACTAVLTWLLARRKYNTEVDNSVIAGLKEALNIYQQISTDNKERLAESQRQIDLLLKENFNMKTEITTLKTQVQILMKYNCMRGNCNRRITNSDDINREEF